MHAPSTRFNTLPTDETTVEDVLSVRCVTELDMDKQKQAYSHAIGYYLAAATSADRARVNEAINDPSCNLSLHPKLNLYSMSAISLIN